MTPSGWTKVDRKSKPLAIKNWRAVNMRRRAPRKMKKNVLMPSDPLNSELILERTLKNFLLNIHVVERSFDHIQHVQ
jgi:hypothetical protein